jgi:hypothetical protein
VSRAGDLLSGRFDVWLDTPPPPLWLFVHVPKTAGSSLAADIATLAPPYRSIHIDHLDRGRPAPERYDAATEAFIAAHAGKPCRFASGHVQFRQAQRIAGALPGTGCSPMLREPVSRLVSDYLYQRSTMHPLAADVRARVPDFAAFIELPGQRNRIARHLVPPTLVKAGDSAAGIARLRDHYAFVGVQERYDLGFRALTTLVAGRPSAPAARKRVNEGAAEEKAAVMRALEDSSLRARIAELNAFDLAVHRAIAADWERIAQPLAAFLESRPQPLAGA